MLIAIALQDVWSTPKQNPGWIFFVAQSQLGDLQLFNYTHWILALGSIIVALLSISDRSVPVMLQYPWKRRCMRDRCRLLDWDMLVGERARPSLPDSSRWQNYS